MKTEEGEKRKTRGESKTEEGAGESPLFGVGN
jgi:hypothetical protein